MSEWIWISFYCIKIVTCWINSANVKLFLIFGSVFFQHLFLLKPAWFLLLPDPLQRCSEKLVVHEYSDMIKLIRLIV